MRILHVKTPKTQWWARIYECNTRILDAAQKAVDSPFFRAFKPRKLKVHKAEVIDSEYRFGVINYKLKIYYSIKNVKKKKNKKK